LGTCQIYVGKHKFETIFAMRYQTFLMGVPKYF